MILIIIGIIIVFLIFIWIIIKNNVKFVKGTGKDNEFVNFVKENIKDEEFSNFVEQTLNDNNEIKNSSQVREIK